VSVRQISFVAGRISRPTDGWVRSSPRTREFHPATFRSVLGPARLKKFFSDLRAPRESPCIAKLGVALGVG